ncbi:Anaphase-promoting complex subunit 10 [Porphyridium purpureum]|uniref:Anaphase-promoting complex subunit 10 n=1 Tax=Porphyridium purpureum TaxID=35688 RepID=A0A5J4YWN1_PORPP|nr:Anaphase-promoting complex subunit 10 [Porphyridium purpureum]|eukprot:POR6651..scf209_3
MERTLLENGHFSEELSLHAVLRDVLPSRRGGGVASPFAAPASLFPSATAWQGGLRESGDGSFEEEITEEPGTRGRRASLVLSSGSPESTQRVSLQLETTTEELRHAGVPPALLNGISDVTATAQWIASSAKPGNGVNLLFDEKPSTFWQSDGAQPHTLTAFFFPRARLVAVQVLLHYTLDESYTPAVIAVRHGTGLHDLVETTEPAVLDEPEGWITLPLHSSVDDVSPSGEGHQRQHLGEEDPESVSGSPLETPSQQTLETALGAHDVASGSGNGIEGQHQNSGSPQLGRSRRSRTVEDDNDLYLALHAHVIQICIHANHQNGRDCHIRGIRALGLLHDESSRAQTQIRNRSTGPTCSTSRLRLDDSRDKMGAFPVIR